MMKKMLHAEHGTYDSHLVIDWSDDSIFDPESEHSHENVQAVKCQRREDPWSSVNGVVTKHDEKCWEREHTCMTKWHQKRLQGERQETH